MTDSIGGNLKSAQHSQVMTALRSAASATGADFSYLVRTAQRESNFNPSAKAPTSSATGLFQFTNDTWLSVLDRYGPKHGVKTEGLSRAELLELREDADLSAKMAGELTGENAKILERRLGRPATSAELYAAHFMGPADAVRLVEAARANNAAPAAVAFPRAATANPGIFYDKDGASLTSAELYTKLTGVNVAVADAGQAPLPAVEGTRVRDPAAILQAQLGITQMTSSLMNALFGLQEDYRG